MRLDGAAEGDQCPVVVVASDAPVNPERYRRLCCAVISRERVRNELRDLIAQECARAALCTLRSRVSQVIDGEDVLRRSLLLLLRRDNVVTSVAHLASLTGVEVSTLQHRWRRHNLFGERIARLKQLVDISLLLKVRAWKNPRLGWEDVSEVYRTTAAHMAALCRRYLGGWSKGDHVAAWLRFTAELRAS